MIKIDSDLYTKYYYLIEDYLKKNNIKDEDYKSFLICKYCEVVNRYYNLQCVKVELKVYLLAALKESKKEYFRIKSRYKKEKQMDPSFDKEDKRKEIYMLDRVWLKEVGTVDLKSDLLKGLDFREICFTLLSLNSVLYERIAKDFKCSLRTVNTVINTAKEKIKINAQNMGYKL